MQPAITLLCSGQSLQITHHPKGKDNFQARQLLQASRISTKQTSVYCDSSHLDTQDLKHLNLSGKRWLKSSVLITTSEKTTDLEYEQNFLIE